jgi:hypothetical protein
MNVERYQDYLQQTLDDYQDDFAIMASLTRTGSNPHPPPQDQLNLGDHCLDYVIHCFATFGRWW